MEIRNNIQNTFGKKITQFINLPGLRCAICGNPLLRMTEVDAFIQKVCGPNANLPAKQSISRYMDTMWYQKGSKAELLGIMEKYAQEYPDKSFGEIFELPEVLKEHLDRAHAYFTENFERSRPVFELMERNLKLSPEQKAKLAELHKKAINISIGNHADSVKRYLIMQNYASFQSEIGGAGAMKLTEYAKKIPLLPGSPDLFLCHMAGKTDAHIMQGFLAPATPIKKRIRHGDGNGIIICQNCSSETAIVPFKSLFFLFPDMFKNIQQQLDMIISYLAKGHLRGHGDYPKVLQRLISEITQGEKTLNLNSYYPLRQQIRRKSSAPLSQEALALKRVQKAEIFENALLKETSDKVKSYILDAEKTKRKMAEQGASAEQIKRQEAYIIRLKKIYLNVLRRDKLI